MPMEFIVPSLCIVAMTELTNSGAVEKRLSELMELEEDHFVTGFHQQFRKHARNLGMTDISNRRSFR
jgi:hypothetical protein